MSITIVVDRHGRFLRVHETGTRVPVPYIREYADDVDAVDMEASMSASASDSAMSIDRTSSMSMSDLLSIGGAKRFQQPAPAAARQQQSLQCSWCRTPLNGEQAKFCQDCNTVYCLPTCQVQHWEMKHRYECPGA
jgi:hypothetical protein